MPKQFSEQATQVKRSRTSGKHSRNGCGRVKCDETRPTCLRCQNFKIACDGYRRTPGTPEYEFQNRRLSLAPKPATSSASPSPSVSSIPSSPSPLFIEDAEEHRYFMFFKEHLLFEITQSGQAGMFRRLILQACNVPAIRCTMIALSALARAHTIMEREISTSLLTIESPAVKIHRDYSLRQYAKGLALMKQAMAAGDQNLRVTTLTCLLIVCIECLHGNFEMASVQVSNGMALLREWRKGYPEATQHPIGISSPAPFLLEDSLVQMLGGLEVRIPSFDDQVRQNVDQNGGDEEYSIITNMPTRFRSFEESRIYIELLIKRSKQLLISIEACHQRSMSIPLSSVPSGQFALMDASSTLNTLSHFPSRHRSLNDISSPSEDAMVTTQQSHLHDFHRWKTSFDSLTANNTTISAHPSYKDQLLSFKTTLLVLRTIIPPDSMFCSPPSQEESMASILDLAEQIHHDTNEHLKGTTFTIYQRISTPPSSGTIELHCKMGVVKCQGRRLLDLLPNTRLSSEVLMNAVFRWVREFEEDDVPLDGDKGGMEGFEGMGWRKGSESSTGSDSEVLWDYEFDGSRS